MPNIISIPEVIAVALFWGVCLGILGTLLVQHRRALRAELKGWLAPPPDDDEELERSRRRELIVFAAMKRGNR